MRLIFGYVILLSKGFRMMYYMLRNSQKKHQTRSPEIGACFSYFSGQNGHFQKVITDFGLVSPHTTAAPRYRTGSCNPPIDWKKREFLNGGRFFLIPFHLWPPAAVKVVSRRVTLFLVRKSHFFCKKLSRGHIS